MLLRSKTLNIWTPYRMVHVEAEGALAECESTHSDSLIAACMPNKTRINASKSHYSVNRVTKESSHTANLNLYHKLMSVIIQ